jgi:hypothetical protein
MLKMFGNLSFWEAFIELSSWQIIVSMKKSIAILYFLLVFATTVLPHEYTGDSSRLTSIL